MIEQLRKTWIKALRSGEYKQAKGMLKDDLDRYCCLGVACVCQGIEVDAKLDGLPGFTVEPEVPAYYLRTFAKNMDLGDDLIQKLINMNDTHNCSFNEIADFLEKEWGYATD